MKNKILIFAGILVAAFTVASISSAQVSVPNLWKLVGNAISPVKSNWELGSATNRISKGWFANFDASTGTIGSLAVSGTVAGDMVVGGVIRNTSGASTTPSYTFNSDTNTGLYLGGSDILRLVTGGNDRLNILADGKVGINTTSPAYTLDVNGNINSTGFKVNGATLVGSQWTTNGTSIGYTAGSVGIGTTNPAELLELGADIHGKLRIGRWDSGTNTAYITTGNSNLSLQVNTRDSLVVKPTGDVYMNQGNVGIGTMGPSEKLHIYKAATNVGQWINADNGQQATLYLGGTKNTAIYRPASLEELGFYTNGGTRMYIKNNGNVGIATTSPRAKLEINSNSFILSTAQTPATSTSTCTTGMIAWDTGYVYVCTATNSWKRSALSTW